MFTIMLDQLHGPVGMFALGTVCSLVENLVRQHSLTHALRAENMSLLAAMQYTNACYDKLVTELDEQSDPGTPLSVRKRSPQRGSFGPEHPPALLEWVGETAESDDPLYWMCQEVDNFKLLYESNKQLLREKYGDQWLTCCVEGGDLIVKTHGKDQIGLINEGLKTLGGFYFEVRNPTVDEPIADIPSSCASGLLELTCNHETAGGSDPRARIMISLAPDSNITMYTYEAIVDTGAVPHCVFPSRVWSDFQLANNKAVTKIMVNSELAFVFTSPVYIKSNEGDHVAVNGGIGYNIHTVCCNMNCCVIGFDIIRDLNLHVLSNGTHFGLCRTCN
jgi:hypothetical protein